MQRKVRAGLGRVGVGVSIQGLEFIGIRVGFWFQIRVRLRLNSG